jgi:hypothetical protein
MPRVSIKYQNGTSVEANNLAEAVFHVAHTGVDYVEEILEDVPPTEPCMKCGGTGVQDGPKPARVMTRKQLEDKIAEINEHAPVAEASFDDRVAAARSLVSD